MFAGRTTVRRAAVVTAGLPDGARVWRRLTWDNAWTVADYLLAAQVDAWRGQDDAPVQRPRDLREQAAKTDATADRLLREQNRTALIAARRQETRTDG